MKYIVGLGNPGEKYSFTRHNIGFLVVEKLMELAVESNNAQSSLSVSKKASLKTFLNNILGRNRNKGWYDYRNMKLCQVYDDLCLIKPMTYMNLSGEIFEFLNNVKLEDTLIVVDEIYLPLGRMRFRSKGSAGGHNGLKSIESSLNTSEYNRLRIGVGSSDSINTANSNDESIDLIDFVLGRFEDYETKLLGEVVSSAAKSGLDWYSKGINFVQQKYNGIDLRF